MARELIHQLNVKFSDEEFEQVNKVSRNFGLNRSEIVRRATNEGLKKFERARLPGSRRGEGSED